MKIYTKGNLVDFEAPIYATDRQKNRIKEFFKENFNDVSFKDVKEPEREYGDRTDIKQHDWIAKDYLKLFSPKSNEDLGDEFKLKTAMGAQVKRGTFVMKFLKWKKQKGENIPITEELIQQFLDEVQM